MLDFSSSPITVNFFKGTAEPIKRHGKVISPGKYTSRMQLIKDSNLYSVAVHSPFSSKPLKLNLIERMYMVVIKVKNADGEFGYVKVNSNSLRKRLGIAENKFKGIKETGLAGFILNKIENIYNNQLVKDDKRNGHGTYTRADGSLRYIGESKDDKRNGQGIYTYPDGSQYLGEFTDDKKNGYGTYTRPDGSPRYVGEFKDDKRNGQGTYTDSDGSRYVGEFKDDYKNGQGIYTYPDGSNFLREYKKDKMIGQQIPINPTSK